MNANQEYRYQNFTMNLLFRDLRFDYNAPKAGDVFPDFDLMTTTGEQIKKNTYAGNKPLLLIFGSLTCPMTASAMPSLKRLHQKFGNQVEFVMLNVREAHPGERIPQPVATAQKMANATALKVYFDIPWMVASDDINGTLHRNLDTKPNAAYLMDTTGKIVFRSIWARDEQSLATALENLVKGRTQVKKQSTKMMMPVIKAMGYFAETMNRGGKRAWKEMWISGFPIALAGTIAMFLKPLPRDYRGISSVTVITATILTSMILVWP